MTEKRIIMKTVSMILILLSFIQGISWAISQEAYRYEQDKLGLIVLTKMAKRMPYDEFRKNGEYLEGIKEWYIAKGEKGISELEFLEITNQKEKYHEINNKIGNKRIINIIGGSLLLFGGGLFWLVNDPTVTNIAVVMITAGVTIGFIGDFFSYLPSEHHLNLEETANLINIYNGELKKQLSVEQTK